MTRPSRIPLWRNSAPGGSAHLHAETDDSSVAQRGAERTRTTFRRWLGGDGEGPGDPEWPQRTGRRREATACQDWLMLPRLSDHFHACLPALWARSLTPGKNQCWGEQQRKSAGRGRKTQQHRLSRKQKPGLARSPISLCISW